MTATNQIGSTIESISTDTSQVSNVESIKTTFGSKSHGDDVDNKVDMIKKLFESKYERKSESEAYSLTMPPSLRPSIIEIMREAFELFSLSGETEFSKKEIFDVFKRFRIYFSSFQAQSVIDKYDINGDGKIDFGEFAIALSRFIHIKELPDDDLMNTLRGISGSMRFEGDTLRETLNSYFEADLSNMEIVSIANKAFDTNYNELYEISVDTSMMLKLIRYMERAAEERENRLKVKFASVCADKILLSQQMAKSQTNNISLKRAPRKAVTHSDEYYLNLDQQIERGVMFYKAYCKEEKEKIQKEKEKMRNAKKIAKSDVEWTIYGIRKVHADPCTRNVKRDLVNGKV